MPSAASTATSSGSAGGTIPLRVKEAANSRQAASARLARARARAEARRGRLRRAGMTAEPPPPPGAAPRPAPPRSARCEAPPAAAAPLRAARTVRGRPAMLSLLRLCLCTAAAAAASFSLGGDHRLAGLFPLHSAGHRDSASLLVRGCDE